MGLKKTIAKLPIDERLNNYQVIAILQHELMLPNRQIKKSLLLEVCFGR